MSASLSEFSGREEWQEEQEGEVQEGGWGFC